VYTNLSLNIRPCVRDTAVFTGHILALLHFRKKKSVVSHTIGA
jgi:hypothetical protein